MKNERSLNYAGTYVLKPVFQEKFGEEVVYVQSLVLISLTIKSEKIGRSVRILMVSV